MTGRIPARLARLLTALLAIAAVTALTASAASAGTIYNNTPKPKPKNLVSLGFEATQTSEFGGVVGFAGSARTSPTIVVTMSSWACQNLLGGVNCASASGASFPWPITVNVYELGPENTQGALIATETQTVNVPYRPSANNKHCTPNAEGAVGYGGSCFHGLAFKVPFTLTGAVLPSQAIVSVAYNTTDYGAAPTHGKDVGEDSLNLGLTEPPEVPSVGTNPLPENAFKNALLESGWEGYQPVYKITAKNK